MLQRLSAAVRVGNKAGKPRAGAAGAGAGTGAAASAASNSEQQQQQQGEQPAEISMSSSPARQLLRVVTRVGSAARSAAEGSVNAAAAAANAAQAARDRVAHAAEEAKLAATAAANRATQFLTHLGQHDEDNVKQHKKLSRVQPLGLRASALVSFVDDHGGRSAFVGLSTSEVCTKFILPLTQENRCSVVEFLRDKGRIDAVGVTEVKDRSGKVVDHSPIEPHFFISHVWSYPFLDTLDAIVLFLSQKEAELNETVLWMDLFCEQHHDRVAHGVKIIEYLAHYRHHIRRFQRQSFVLVIEDWPAEEGKLLTVLSRAWCIFELYVSRITGVRMEIAMPPAAQTKFSELLRNSPESAFNALKLANLEDNLKAGSVLDLAALCGIFETNVTFPRLETLIKGTLGDLVINEVRVRLQRALADENEADEADWNISIGRLQMILSHGAGGKDDGIKYISKAIEIRKKIYGRDDERTIKAMIMMAMYYRSLQLYEKSVELLLGCYDSRSRKLGENHELTLKVLNNIASTKLLLGENAFGESALLRCLEARRASLGVKHPDSIESLSNLATFFIEQKRWSEAVELLSELQDLYAETLGEMHHDHLTALNNLAVCLDRLKRSAEAMPRFEAVLDAQITLANNDPPYDVNTLQTMFNLAACYERLDMLEKAAEKFERCSENRKILFGTEHPDTLRAMSQQACVLYRLKDTKNSLRVYEEVVVLQKKVLGLNHADTLITLNNMANLYSTINLYHRALPLYQEVYLSQVRILGLHHRDTLGAMSNLGTALYKVGDYKTACPVVEQCLSMRSRYLGPDHPDTSCSMNNLAFIYEAMADDESAYGLLERSLAARRRTLGDKHPQTVQSVNHLIEMYRKMGAYHKIMALKESLEKSGAFGIGGSKRRSPMAADGSDVSGFDFNDDGGSGENKESESRNKSASSSGSPKRGGSGVTKKASFYNSVSAAKNQ